LKGKKAQDVFNATNILLEPIKGFVKTITYDNGKEFFMHKKQPNN
jgi:IS30 family transposase